MIDVEIAVRVMHRLREQGTPWEPASGDRFVIPDRDIDGVFVLSDMTIEVADLPTGRMIMFNGTTEWALDSISAEEVVWLPWEHQLRDLLGPVFQRLELIPGEQTGFAVVLRDGSRHLDVDADAAYARAFLDRY